MGMIKRLAAGWKAMTAVEKVKFVLDAMVNVGCAAIAGEISAEATKDYGPVTKICGVVAGAGLGIAAGNAASKAVDETVDAAHALYKMRKAHKEAKANAG